MTNAGFFTIVTNPEILMDVLKDCITFPIMAAWILFNFDRKQKQIFSLVLPSFPSMDAFGLDIQK